MAFEKEFETGFGVIATYWKVARTDIDWHDRCACIILYGYINANARRSGKSPIGQECYKFDNADFDFSPTDNVIAKCYAKIKAMAEWSGSVDV